MLIIASTEGLSCFQGLPNLFPLYRAKAKTYNVQMNTHTYWLLFRCKFDLNMVGLDYRVLYGLCFSFTQIYNLK